MAEANALAVADPELEGTVKAYVLGDGDTQPSNASPTTEDDNLIFQSYGAIQAPYDPRQMTSLFERSTALRPNIDVYKTNIEGYGHRLEPTIDLKADDAKEQVRDALLLEAIANDVAIPRVDESAVDATMLMLETEMRLEKLRAEQFFRACTGDISFTEFRERARQDLETTGNAYIEVLRDGMGRPAQLVLVPSISMRLMRIERQYVDVTELRRTSPLGFKHFCAKRRVRRFVQVLYGQLVAFFKELGDPRLLSATTGKHYPNIEALRRAEPSAPLATEIIHLKIHSSTTAYGVPRWVGATPAVLGSRASEEVNLTYFDNKAIPPLAILVSGGTLAKGAAAMIETYIRDNIKGRDNFHNILLIEAESAQSGAISGANGSRCRIDIKNLMDAQHSDGLFQQYDANNAEKIGNQFRLPKILRGDMKDFNRATADAALDYAEQQVFAPEREKIDHMINRRLMPLLGIRFFDFVSNAVQIKDQPQLAEMIAKHVEGGIITPNEGRELSSDVFGKTFKKRDEPFFEKPLELSIAEAKAAAAAAPPATDEGKSLEHAATRLVQLRAALAEVEGQAGKAALDAARTNEGTMTIQVPQEEFNRWFESREA